MPAEQPNETIWPRGCTGAVSLTFDDGSDSQLRRGVPLLERHGLRGTFYIAPRGDDYLERLALWRDVPERGHEIGNHTLSHTCSRNFRLDRNGRGLETATLADIEADILAAQERLCNVFPDHAPRTFAYPCYQTDVGEGLTRQSYVPVVAKHFIAARATGEYGFFNHPFNVDLHCLWCVSGQQMTAGHMAGLTELAVGQGRWIIFAFHGIDEGRLGVSGYDFGELLAYLAARRERIWTAPVAEVTDHLLVLRRAE